MSQLAGWKDIEPDGWRVISSPATEGIAAQITTLATTSTSGWLRSMKAAKKHSPIQAMNMLHLRPCASRSDSLGLTQTDSAYCRRCQRDPPHCPSHPVSYTHLRAHETDSYLVCRLLLEKKKKPK